MKDKQSLLDEKLEAIQRSTRTLFPFMLPAHEWARQQSKTYYNWHTKHYASKVHWSTLIIYVLLIGAIMVATLVPGGRTLKAQALTKAWSTSAEFDTGTKVNVDSTGNELKLTSTTNSDYNETFDTTTYKDAATAADWNTTAGKVALPGDPNGSATDLTSVWRSIFPSGYKASYPLLDIINAIGYDKVNNRLYMIGNGGTYGGNAQEHIYFAVYNPTDNTIIDLSDKLGGWSSGGGAKIANMAFDPDGYVYLVNNSGLARCNTPANPTHDNITCDSYFGGGGGGWNEVNDVQYNPHDGNIYVGRMWNFQKYNPHTGVWTELKDKIGMTMGIGQIFVKSAVDPTTGKVYYTTLYNQGLFGVYDPDTDTATNLTDRVSNGGWWSIAFNSSNNFVYLRGYSSPQGYQVYDPATDTGSSITDSSTWGPGDCKPAPSSIYDSVNNKWYLTGCPDGQSFINIKSGLTVTDNTYTNASSILNGIITSTLLGISSNNNGTVYLGSYNGEFAKVDLGYQNNKDAISTTIDSTDANISSATLTASDETKPDGTAISYYLSNDGGSTWESATSGTLHNFTSVGSDLRWKANLTSTDLAKTPEVGNIAVSYSYYSASGTWNAKFDAGQTVAWVASDWTKTLPTNTSLAFKYRSADTEANLSSATWSDTVNATADTANLKTINGGSALIDNQWLEVQADFATTGISTPVLSDIAVDYVINEPPQVQNVTASQTTDGTKTVNISYEARDTDTASGTANPGQVTVAFQYSIDSGTNWLDCTTTTGEGLQDITSSYTTKTGTWNVGTDLANAYYNGTVMIRVNLDDNELAHNTATASSSLFTVKTTSPAAVSLLIHGNDDNDTWTNSATVTLADEATDATYMKFSNNGTTYSPNQTYATSASWNLQNTNYGGSATDGTKTVYVKFVDDFGNESTAISDTILLDTTPPATPANLHVYDTSERSIDRYSLTLIWDSVANSGDLKNPTYVIERSTDGTNYSQYDTASIPVYTDQNVDKTTTYYYRVKAQDIHDNTSSASAVASLQPASADITPPVISGGNPTATPAETSAVITWTTDESADSYVEYGANTNYGSVYGNADMTTNHSVTIPGLTGQTLYHFRVRSTDASGNITLGNDFTFMTTSGATGDFEQTPQAQAPGASTTSAEIVWKTNKYSSSQVLYGLTSSLGSSTTEDPTLNLTHQVTVSGLSPATTYYYQARSVDTYNQEILSDMGTFTTAGDITGPEITSINALVASAGTSATVTWITNEAATSEVYYDTTSHNAYTDYTLSSVGTDKDINHTRSLTGLTTGTKYYYRVRSVDASGNATVSSEQQFTTTTFPTVSNIVVSSGIITSATITWTTNIATDSRLVYGTTTDYGKTAGDTQNLTLNHSVTLDGLDRDTTYHFKIFSRDENGNTVVDTDHTFTTTPDVNRPTGSFQINNNDQYTTSQTVTLNVTATDVETQAADLLMSFSNDGSTWTPYEAYAITKTWTLSNGSGLKIVYAKFKDTSGNESDIVTDTITYDSADPEISDKTVTIGTNGTTASVAWKTNEEATSGVYYDTVAHEIYSDYAHTATSASFDTNHALNLSDLSNGSRYYYVVRSVDKSGRVATSAESYFDTATYPTVSNVTLGSTTISSQVINWSSNIATDSNVEYGTTSGTYTASAGDTANLSTTHSITVKGLSSGTKYYYRVRSRDANGNIVVSSEGNFTTNTDTSLPSGTISINNGAAYTNSATVNVAISTSDTGEGGYVSQMRFSNDGNTWSSWESFTGIKAWNITDTNYGGTSTNGTKTVYAQVKDNSGNSSTNITSTIVYDNTAPVVARPNNISATSNRRPIITWVAAQDDTSDVEGYYIKIGTTDGGNEDLTETWIGNNTSYTPTIDLSQGTHYVQIKAKDNAGNTSGYTTSGTIDIDITAPSNGSLSIASGANYTTSQAVVLTVSSEGATQMAISNDGVNWGDWQDYATSKVWTLSDGEGLKTIYIKFKDAAGNVSDTYVDSIIYDATAPTITDVSSGSVTYNSAVVDWTTSENATSQVEYGPTTQYGSTTTVDSTKNISHNVALTNLTTGITYHYRVISKDAAGNEAASSDYTLTTVVYPSVSSVVSSEISNNSAAITWKTNVTTDSFIEYGTTNSYGSLAGKSDSVTTHDVKLAGLLADTTYYYRVKSTDEYGNSALGESGSFKTAKLAAASASISSTTVTTPQAKDVVTTDISIVWSTNNEGSSYVDYGLTTSYGDSQGQEEMVTSHIVNMTGLQSGTTYHYRVRSIDKDGNVFVSEDKTFTTPELTTPSISAVAITDVTLNGATISWKTNQTATTQIEYSTTEGDYSQKTTEDTSANTSHTVKLDNLTAGAKYYFRVKSKVISTNDLLTSNTYMFSTITLPEVFDLNAVDISETKATINWTTNVDTDSVVSFGDSSSLGQQQGVDSPVKSHNVTLIGLKPQTTYYYQAKSRDNYGNIATSSVTTFTTKTDTTGPEITDVKTESTTVGSGETSRVQVIVSWMTDEPATSVVEYGLGLGATGGEEDKVYEKKTSEDTTYNQSHITILSGLNPSSTYHLRVKSVDKFGNVNYSKDYTVLTPAKEQSLIQVIVKTLEETFGWIGNLKDLFSSQK